MHQRTLLPQRPVWQLIINKSNHTNITIQGLFYLMTTFLVKGSRTISFGRNIKKAYCLSLSRQKIVLDWQDLSAYWGFVSLIWLVSNFQSCYTSVGGGQCVWDELEGDAEQQRKEGMRADEWSSSDDELYPSCPSISYSHPFPYCPRTLHLGNIELIC